MQYSLTLLLIIFFLFSLFFLFHPEFKIPLPQIPDYENMPCHRLLPLVRMIGTVLNSDIWLQQKK